MVIECYIMLTEVTQLLYLLNLKVHKNSSLLTILCLTAMTILLGLQGYWIIKYYGITKQNFEKEVNMAYEDAFKKEFSNRADRIQKIIKARLLDTTHFLITSKRSKTGEVMYQISETKNPADRFSNSFSTSRLNVMITENNKKAVINQVAENFSKMLRNEDLNNRVIYYRTQNLGKFMSDLTHKIEFDTANLRPVLNTYLAKKSIYVDYQFYVKDTDSTTNESTFSPSLLAKFPIITRSLPTYRHSPGQNYLRIMFKDPYSYILSNMWLIFISSLFLVTLIAFCLNYLLRSLKKAKQLAHIKNDFISNITHEFKTPIATALLAVEALGEKDTLDDKEKTTRYLKHTKNELIRIGSLTDKILKMSIYDRSDYALKKENIQVNIVIQEIIDIYILQKSSKITFKNNTAVSSILVDREQFQHAISNILENAIKYGKDPIEISILCSLENNYFVINVVDNGTGIDASEIPFIFDKFYRGKQSTHSLVKGYGLGLNYVKQIMQRHEGWHRATSNTNGTEIKLAWPI